MSLSVTESESVALKVVSNTSANSCGHRVIAYDLDGQQKQFDTTNAELGVAPGVDAERELVMAFLRFRRARGKTEVNARIV